MSVRKNGKRNNKKIRALKVRRGLRSIELAKAAGISRQALWMILSDRQTPTLGTASKLAKALKCSIDDLIG